MRAYYKDVISEYFDISDRNTRTILLSLDEADQNNLLLSLTSKLYNIILDHTTDIDFGDIPKTKGDIKALKEYPKMRECLDVMEGILKEYRQPLETVDTIRAAMDFIENDKPIYTKGFMIKSDIIMVTYNTMVLSIVNSISYLIACTVEYIKTTGSSDFKIVFDKAGLARTKDSLVYDNLVAFNKACREGQVESAFRGLIQHKVRNFAVSTSTLTAVATMMAVCSILINILPIVRELTYFFYSGRTRISQYFDLQADLLEMNVQGIEAGEVQTIDDKKMVIKKQSFLAQKFRKIAEFFMVNTADADKKATKMQKEDNKDMNVNDVVNSKPDSANTYGNTLF